jgi:hypothetical protein
VVTEDKVIAEVKPATTVTKEERKTSRALKKKAKKAPEPKPVRGQTQYLEGA